MFWKQKKKLNFYGDISIIACRSKKKKMTYDRSWDFRNKRNVFFVDNLKTKVDKWQLQEIKKSSKVNQKTFFTDEEKEKNIEKKKQIKKLTRINQLNVYVKNVWYVELCHLQTRSADTNSNKYSANDTSELIEWIN